MTSFLYSAIGNGGSIAFEPATDVLVIDDAALSAADFILTPLANGAGVRWSLGAQSFTLAGVTLSSLGEGNVHFADGSLLLNADVSNSYSSSLVGSTHDDVLVGARPSQIIDLVARTLAGKQTSAYSDNPNISADGRFVVFASNGSALSGDVDSNDISDIFVKDLLTGTVTRVSETAAGGQSEDSANSWGSRDAVVSGDGRYVVFQSYASNLVAGDTNGWSDVFVKDLKTGAIKLVSTSSTGTPANAGGDTYAPTMSADGRYVAFVSGATNLVAGDTNNSADVFVKDLKTGQLTRVSTSSSGVQGDGGSSDNGSTYAKISADAKFVVFESEDKNLIAGDTDAYSDVFIKNLQTGVIRCVSVGQDGLSKPYTSENPDISADGRYVVFESASNLLGDDQDGWGSIYLRDLQTDTLVRVKDAGGYEFGQEPKISGDGRFIVFSTSSALVADDSNGLEDVYVKDMRTGEMARVSVSAGGEQADGRSLYAEISLDGTTIVFRNDGSSLSADDKNGSSDSYVVSNPLYERKLAGGTGDDTYVISNRTDAVAESAGEGTDTVRAAVTYTLTVNVENLVLTGSAAINGVGNALDNHLTGNAAANTLNGSSGADTMAGGGGDDLYYVDHAGDQIVDSSGVDTVRSSVNHVLETGVENLTLTGSAALDGTGNDRANIISGNSGDNVLTGGLGVDTVSYADAVAAVSVDLGALTPQATGGSGTDTLSGFENVTGSAFADTLLGTSDANLINGGKGADTMTAGAGDDTYVVDNVGDACRELANEGGDRVLSSIDITLQAEIENLVLTGTAALAGHGNGLANLLVGNATTNALSGEAGDDTLDGGAGADSLTGGAGNDTYVVDHAGDKTMEVAGGGTDMVQSSVSFSLQSEVERLTLTGSAAINATGNTLANTLVGNAAANVLNGGVGADSLAGGAGSDTYVVDATTDVISETVTLATEIDTVQSTVAWTLGANLERLTLTGSSAINGTGNSLANTLTGNGSANALNGGSGNDTLSAGAGNDTLNGNTGTDSLIGGTGSDSYYVDVTSDKVVETSTLATEIDTVMSTVSWTLGNYIERLTLSGTAALNGTGNSLANTLIGNSGANALNGGSGNDTVSGGSGNDTLDGSAGVDSLIGGTGNDTYYVESTSDKVTETSTLAAEIDTVVSSVSWTLGSYVERLMLSGSAAVNATGNSLANTLTGNSGANALNGGSGNDTVSGGSGNDTLNGSTGVDSLTGGAGNDTYYVDSVSDKVTETSTLATEIDTVVSSVSWTLGGYVERLTLSGTAAVNGNGNTLANTLTGNAAGNLLNGGGGSDTVDGKTGADTMTGGAGADTFAFTTGLASDLITDFTSGADKLRVSQGAIKVGDGDTSVEGAVAVSGPNGFGSAAELVIITHDISGSITASSAAAAIGHASSSYKAGDTRLFIVDNGQDSATYLFKSADAGATVTSSELTLLATLDNTHATVATDFLFGA